MLAGQLAVLMSALAAEPTASETDAPTPGQHAGARSHARARAPACAPARSPDAARRTGDRAAKFSAGPGAVPDREPQREPAARAAPAAPVPEPRREHLQRPGAKPLPAACPIHARRHDIQRRRVLLRHRLSQPVHRQGRLRNAHGEVHAHGEHSGRVPDLPAVRGVYSWWTRATSCRPWPTTPCRARRRCSGSTTSNTRSSTIRPSARSRPSRPRWAATPASSCAGCCSASTSSTAWGCSRACAAPRRRRRPDRRTRFRVTGRIQINFLDPETRFLLRRDVPRHEAHPLDRRLVRFSEQPLERLPVLRRGRLPRPAGGAGRRHGAGQRRALERPQLHSDGPGRGPGGDRARGPDGGDGRGRVHLHRRPLEPDRSHRAHRGPQLAAAKSLRGRPRVLAPRLQLELEGLLHADHAGSRPRRPPSRITARTSSSCSGRRTSSRARDFS